MNNTALIIIPIPPDIPMPRYRLFQRVQFATEIYQGTGQVTGLEWVASAPANLTELEAGWSYRVNCDGATSSDPAPCFFEEELAPSPCGWGC